MCGPVRHRLRGVYEPLEDRWLLAITPTFLAGTLNVVITGNENVAISSDGVNVLINGADLGVALSAAVQAIIITATDPTASNTIDITGVTSSLFSFVGFTTISLNGGEGADTYLIDQSVLPGIVNIVDSGVVLAGGDSVQITTSSVLAETIGVSGLAVTRTSGPTVNYAGIETLSVTGTSVGDVITVTGTGADTTINGAGGADTFTAIDPVTVGHALTLNAGAGAVEQLTINLSGPATLDVSATVVQQSGFGAITYTGFEKLVVNGSGDVDTFNIHSTAPSMLTTVFGGGGVDVFNVTDLSAVATMGALGLDGGGDGDFLTVQAGLPVEGNVNVAAGNILQGLHGTVAYASFGTLTVNGTGGADSFVIGATNAATLTRVFGLGGVDSFSTIGLAIVGAAGMLLNGGGDGESLVLQAVAGQGTALVDSAQVKQGVHGAVQYAGFGSLVVQGTAAVDDFDINSTAAGVTTTVTGLGGVDTFQPIDLSTIGAGGSLNVDAGGNGESLTVNTGSGATVGVSGAAVQQSGNGPVNYSGFASLLANGAAGGETFNVLSTSIATNVDAGLGNDTINVGNAGSLSGIVAALTINGQGNDALPTSMLDSGSVSNSLPVGDTLHLDDSAFATAGSTYTLAAGTFTRTGLSTINFGTVETIVLDAGSGGNLIDITGTAASANVTVNGGIGADTITLVSNGTSSNVSLNAGDGTDTLTIQSVAAGSVVIANGGADVDTFTAIDLTAIDATAGLKLDADGGVGELLTLNVTAAGSTTTITSTTVQRTGNGLVTYTDFENLTVNGTAGVDTFNVLGTATGTLTTVNANGSTDLFGAVDLTTIGTAGLTIDADGGVGELLTLNVTAAGSTTTITSTTVQRTGNGLVTYTDFENLTVNGTAGVDTFNVLGTATGTLTTVNANGSTDLFGAIDLTTIGTAGLTIDADGGVGEVLNLNLGTAGTATLTGTTAQRSGNGLVTYTNFEVLNLNGTAGVDAINIQSTLSTVSYTVSSDAGNDTITLGNAGVLDGIQGALVIHGDAHSAVPTTTLNSGSVSNTLPVGDTLHFDDSAKAGGAIYTLNPGSLARAGIAAITFDTVETIILDTGTGGDTVNLPTTAASVNVTVHSGAGNDTLTLQGNGAASNVVLDGGANDDILNILGVATGSVVFANGGSENDTVNVSSDAPTNNGTLDTILGGLRVDTGAGSDKLIVSDRGQVTTANSHVEVRNNRINGFAGPANAAQIDYLFGGALELTLLGSNTLDDDFHVVLPSLAGLTMRFDGGGGTDDHLRIEGTSGNDTALVGDFASGRPFQIQNLECLKMFGGDGDDTLDNGTSVSSLIDGGSGNDTLIGGSATDVIFGGNGVDHIFGNGGDDYLFGDHLYNNGAPIAGPTVNGDEIVGGTGIDTLVSLGNDIISAGGDIGDTIVGQGFQLTTVDWLRARFLKPNSSNIAAAIAAAMAQHCAQP